MTKKNGGISWLLTLERLCGAALFLQPNGRHQAVFSVAGELFLDSADKFSEVVIG